MRATAFAESAIDFSYASPELRPVQRSIVRGIERIGGQQRLKRLYTRYLAERNETTDFFETALEYLDVDVRYDAAALSAVPSTDPVVFVANHPFGVLDGIVLTWLARSVRPDVLVMANRVLCQAPDTSGNLLPVDFSRTREAALTNLASRKACQDALGGGGAVGVFPAGGVAASRNLFKGPAVDSPWHPFVAKMIQRSRATVVPVYFDGQNSRLFQMASHLSYTLRLALFFFETVRRIGSRLEVVVGAPVPYEEIAALTCRDTLLRELRARTFALADGLPSARRKPPRADQEFVLPKRFGF